MCVWLFSFCCHLAEDKHKGGRCEVHSQPQALHSFTKKPIPTAWDSIPSMCFPGHITNHYPGIFMSQLPSWSLEWQSYEPSYLPSQSLSHCELITDDGILHLSNSTCGHERLRVLELDNCLFITDVALEHLENCRGLERLELYDCQQVTHAGIKRMWVSVSPSWSDFSATE